MTGKRPNTIRIADDDRARIPFAMIAVLLMITSIMIVGVLQTRDTPDVDTGESLAMDRAEATTQSEIRHAVVRATDDAARAPLTNTENTAVGNAIDASASNDDQRFENYVRLLIYIEVTDALAKSEQHIGTDQHANAELESIDWDEQSEIQQAIESIELERGVDNTVDVTVRGVEITVTEEGDEVRSERQDVTVTVATPIFELHDRTNEYQEELWLGLDDFSTDTLTDESLTRDFAMRMYAYTWGKAYFERLTATPHFDQIVVQDHSEVLLNDAVFTTQERVFGTSDRYSDRAMSGPVTCMGAELMVDILDLGVDWNTDERQQTEGSGDAGDTNSDDGDEPDVDTDDWLEDLDEDVEDFVMGFCDTEWVQGDSEGEIDDPPAVSDILHSLIDVPAENQDVEVNVHPYADMAYVQSTPESWTDGDLEDRFRDRLFDRDSDLFHEDYLDTHFGDEDDMYGDDDHEDPVDDDDKDRGDPDGVSDDFDRHIEGLEGKNNAEEVITDVFTVDIDPRRTSTNQNGTFPTDAPDHDDTANWSQVDSGYTTWGESADVDINRVSDDDSSSLDRELASVDIEYEQTVRHWRDWENTSSDSDRTERTRGNSTTIEFTASYRIDGDFAPDINVHDHVDIETLLDPTTSPGPLTDNFNGVQHDAVRHTFDPSTQSGIANEIEEAGSDGEITGLSSFRSAIPADTSSTTNEYEPNADVEEWIVDELDDIHVELVAEIEPKETTFIDLAKGETSITVFKTRVETIETELIYHDYDGQWENPNDMARAELRHAYIENIKEQIDEGSDFQDEGADMGGSAIQEILGSILDGADGLVEGPLGLVQEVLNDPDQIDDHNVEDPIESPVMDDVTYEIDASPTYLESSSVERDEVAAVRPPGGNVTDPDEDPVFPSPYDEVVDWKHAPMASMEGNMFGHPGFPLLPYPMLFWLQLDAWVTWHTAEYARFEVRADSGDPTSTDGTNYVREDKDVYIEIPQREGGDELKAGSVDPIQLHQVVPIPVVVPSPKVPIPGQPGVGDRWRYTGGEQFRCSDWAPFAGPIPEPDELDGRDGDACLEEPDNELWEEWIDRPP